MHIGVPRETRARGTRVAATPATVAQLVALGYDVVVETGAGAASSFPDEAYAGAGARIGATEEAWQDDVVLRLNAPAGGMDAVPRISRAQSMDVLSGEKTWPPPPVQVSAAPAPAATPPASREPAPPARPPSPGRRFALVALGAALLFLVTALSPNEVIQHFTVFAPAVVVGSYVIGHVHHALHTPQMSVTNAISGIIVVGALLQIGPGDVVVTTLAFLAVLVASTNVFGGFAVTRRMLGMFTRG